MNERMKILELLRAGKITTEQADMLLAAVDAKSKRIADSPSFADRFPRSDWKSLGSQVSAAVAQALGDVKRVVEQQLDTWSLSSSTVTVTRELSVPLDAVNVSTETTHGKVQIFPWDEPHVKIDVRAQMRTTNLGDGKKALENALQINRVDCNYELAVVHGQKDVETNTLVTGAHLDLYVPNHRLEKLRVHTQNGSIFADAVQVCELYLETTNGGISLFRTRAERLHLETNNGSIDIQGIDAACRNVYAYTKNGTLNVEGLPADLRCAGTARTAHGRIDIRSPRLVVEYGDQERKNFVRFSHTDVEADHEGARIHLETRNGSIKVRS